MKIGIIDNTTSAEHDILCICGITDYYWAWIGNYWWLAK